MLDNKEELLKQIGATAKKLGIDSVAVEKDLYVTKIIHAMSQVEHEHYRLVFQGGTCLAKAHKIIPRMSEDCDFRIEKRSSVEISRTKARNELKDFRMAIKENLQNASFLIDDSKIKIRDEGHFISMKLDYQSIYANEILTLKPFLAIDFFLGEVKNPTIDLPITTLIKNTLGDIIEHPQKSIACVSIAETAAEKLVGLTRRIATINTRQHYNDPSLVRHIYDLYKINSAGKLDEEFSNLIIKILPEEINKFKTHNMEYATNPHKEISRALKILESKEWRQNWNQFINDMVFEQNPPSYDDALKNLNTISNTIFEIKIHTL
jgi:predicted nucleotidyltransferase component of viral defense system